MDCNATCNVIITGADNQITLLVNQVSQHSREEILYCCFTKCFAMSLTSYTGDRFSFECVEGLSRYL